MDKEWKIVIGAFVLVALIISVSYGVLQLSTISSDTELVTSRYTEFTSISCEDVQDCRDYFLSHGVSAAELASQEKEATLYCDNDKGYCVARD
jgi:hypothetical protein